MRILWHSASPLARSGYGNVTRELIVRLRDVGHFVRVITKHMDHTRYEWEGFEIYDGTDMYYVNKMLVDEEFDYIWSLFDIWVLDGKRLPPKEKWVAMIPVDTEWISTVLKRIAEKVGFPIAYSRHGERELKSIGLNPWYAPHGIDTKTFRIKPKGRKAFRESMNWGDDTFVIGTVGMNYADDRKGFIPLLRAFKKFNQEHKESRLFIHSLANERGVRSNCINYIDVVNSLGLGNVVGWPLQMDYHFSRYTEGDLADIYNGMDVMCLPTRGEGFGLPIIEAQACGAPVIVTDTSTGRELCRTGRLIHVDDNELRWIPNGTWRYECKEQEILESLQSFYADFHDDGYDRREIREEVIDYDWDNVWKTYFVPIINKLEENLKKQEKDNGEV